MANRHQYKSTIVWTGNKGQGTADYGSYERHYLIKTTGKPDVLGSADPMFRGDKTLHNPEDLFLASLSSCHMLWYLHLCADAGIKVQSYSDDAQGVLELESDGSGQFSTIELRPNIEISDKNQLKQAEVLHQKAHQFCFIARSCTSKISIFPTIKLTSNA